MPRTGKLAIQGFCCVAGQFQRARDRVAAGRYEVTARRLREPWLDRSGKAADQAQAIDAEANERLRQSVDVGAGKLQQLDRDRITGGGMVDDLRREGCEI